MIILFHCGLPFLFLVVSVYLYLFICICICVFVFVYSVFLYLHLCIVYMYLYFCICLTNIIKTSLTLCSPPPEPDWQEGGGNISFVQFRRIAGIIALSLATIMQL